jgi:hypothetical protein
VDFGRPADMWIEAVYMEVIFPLHSAAKVIQMMDIIYLLFHLDK